MGVLRFSAASKDRDNYRVVTRLTTVTSQTDAWS